MTIQSVMKGQTALNKQIKFRRNNKSGRSPKRKRKTGKKEQKNGHNT